MSCEKQWRDDYHDSWRGRRYRLSMLALFLPCSDVGSEIALGTFCFLSQRLKKQNVPIGWKGTALIQDPPAYGVEEPQVASVLCIPFDAGIAINIYMDRNRVRAAILGLLKVEQAVER